MQDIAELPDRSQLKQLNEYKYLTELCDLFTQLRKQITSFRFKNSDV